MPASAPKINMAVVSALILLGKQIRMRRKSLGLSATITSESAGISRMTLSRIENGEPSVTIGSYASVLSVLGSEIGFIGTITNNEEFKFPKNFKVEVKKFPQLQKLAWQLKNRTALTPKQALSLYERNWRHLDKDALTSVEKEFITKLLKHFGKDRLLV